jgi:predicted deacylase
MRDVYLETKPEEMKGSLVFTPILNPIAFVEWKKQGFLDALNLDQQFPGKADGLISQRIASQIFNELKKIANAVISFHAPGAVNYAPPYTVSKIVPGANSEVVEKSFRMALSFGVKHNIRVNIGTTKEEMPGVTAGTLDSICVKQGIPCFMAEMGRGGRWEVPIVAIAQKGIYNVMRFLGIAEGEPEIPGEQIVIPERKYLRNSRGGFLEILVQPGDVVRKGEVCARVINFWEVLEELKSEKDMYVIQVRENPVVSTGEKCLVMGFDWYTLG